MKKTFSNNVIVSSASNGLKHGMAQTYFYRVWHQMKERCFNENHASYTNYGGRGIKVSERWLNFHNFKDDMFEKYLIHLEEFGRKQTSLDRIDNDSEYSSKNCRWATRTQQLRNTRLAKNKDVLRGLCEENGISIKTYSSRRYRGWEHLEALKTPINPNIRKREFAT